MAATHRVLEKNYQSCMKGDWIGGLEQCVQTPLCIPRSEARSSESYHSAAGWAQDPQSCHLPLPYLHTLSLWASHVLRTEEWSKAFVGARQIKT